MAQSNERRKRRATKAVSKKAAKGLARNGGIDVSKEVSLDPEVQGIKIVALEKALGRLVEMITINQKEYLKAFQLSDAHLWVLRQLCKDIVADTVMMANSETPAVNMEVYYDLFNALQKRQADEAAKKKALEEAGIAPLKEGPEVFGGDSAHAGT